jgi:quercetin dioxygenase-like cupin family protein
MAEPYSVKSVTVLARGAGYLVREFVFAPGEGTPFHRHSQVADLTCVVEGAIVCETEGGARTLGPGDRDETPPGTVHRLVNRGDADCRVLLIQHGGAYDFVTVAR